jgi:murein DD-endopeptidase MepM/ murein hydrolase activator NlpD
MLLMLLPNRLTNALLASGACLKNISTVFKRDTRFLCFAAGTILILCSGCVEAGLSPGQQVVDKSALGATPGRSDRALSDEAVGKSSSRETLIKISSEKQGLCTQLYVENVQAAEVTVTFEMDLVNLDASVDFPYTTTLPAKKKVRLFTLMPHNPGHGWSWTYTYYSTFGSTSVEHDDSYIYTLPYAPGKTYRVSQGFNGEYSHFGADQFAIDWRMPIGTAVHAARGGLVVGVKSDSNVGGDDSKYDWDANYILIQHADGTLGQYVHLQKGGVAVKLGQPVEAGDFIGLSGNTGHSTGPHLHFSVFKARDGKHRQTIPIKYKTNDEFAITLAEGKSYRASGDVALAAANREKNARLLKVERVAERPTKEPELVPGTLQAAGH